MKIICGDLLIVYDVGSNSIQIDPRYEGDSTGIDPDGLRVDRVHNLVSRLFTACLNEYYGEYSLMILMAVLANHVRVTPIYSSWPSFKHVQDNSFGLFDNDDSLASSVDSNLILEKLASSGDLSGLPHPWTRSSMSYVLLERLISKYGYTLSMDVLIKEQAGAYLNHVVNSRDLLRSGAAPFLNGIVDVDNSEEEFDGVFSL